jgi:hypothetical protein
MELTRRQMLRASLGALAAGSCSYAVATPTPVVPKNKLQLHAVDIEVPLFERRAICTRCDNDVLLASLSCINPIGFRYGADAHPETSLLVRGPTCRGCIHQPDIHKALEAYCATSTYWVYDKVLPGTQWLKLHADELTVLFDPLTQTRRFRWKGTDSFWQLWRGDKYLMQRLPYDMMRAAMCSRTLMITAPNRSYYKRVPV